VSEVDTSRLVISYTHETNEKACQFEDEGCPKVAVWRGVFTNMPCEHNMRLYCDPHKEQVKAWEADLGEWLCRYCSALGTPPIKWERP